MKSKLPVILTLCALFLVGCSAMARLMDQVDEAHAVVEMYGPEVKESAERLRELYDEHKDKPFFGELVDFITSGPTVQMVWEGPDVVAQVRKMNGATNPAAADCGTIRGDFCTNVQNNVIHASDSVETAVREIALYFDEAELLSYEMPDDRWLVG